MECKHHPDAQAEEVKVLDDTEEVARFYKREPLGNPVIVEEPTDEEIDQLELDALNISLSQGQKALKYKALIDERVFSERDLEAVEPKPKKRGKKHGSFCSCAQCEAAYVVVGGEIVNMRVIKTKNDEPMAFVEFAHGVNHYRTTIFPGAYKSYHKLLSRPTTFLVAGHKDDRNSIIVAEIADVVDVAEELGWEPDKVVSIKRAKNPRKKMKLKKKVAA